MAKKQTKPARKPQRANRVRWGVVVLLLVALIGIGAFFGFRIVADSNRGEPEGSHDSHGHGPHEVTDEQKAQADKIFKKYLTTLIASDGKYSAENYTPSSDSPSAAVITGRQAYDVGNKTIATSLSYTCTARIGNRDVTLNATVQTQNADTYVRLNRISGQDPELAARNAKAQGIWYKLAQPDAAIQAQLDSGVFVFNSGLVAPGYDAGKIADILIRENAYGYDLHGQAGSNYTFDITTRKDNYAAALKQAFPDLASVDVVIGKLFPRGVTELESSLTLHEDGAAVNELGLRSDACPEQVKMYLGPASAQDGRTPAMLKALSVNRTAAGASITPVTRWQPAAEYGQ